MNAVNSCERQSPKPPKSKETKKSPESSEKVTRKEVKTNFSPFLSPDWYFSSTFSLLSGRPSEWLFRYFVSVAAPGEKDLFLQILGGEKLLEKSRWNIFERPERGFKIVRLRFGSFFGSFIAFFKPFFVSKPNVFRGQFRSAGVPFCQKWPAKKCKLLLSNIPLNETPFCMSPKFS